MKISILQCNARRGGAITDAILNLGAEAKAPIILIQEPWWSKELKVTKTLAGYQLILPPTSGRPRVATHIRRPWTAYIQHDHKSGDILETKLPDLRLTVFNIYRARNRAPNPTLGKILNIIPPPRSLLAGDFNAIGSRWTSRPGQRPEDERFEEWTVEKGLELCSTPDVPTHRNGHTLDLVWANFPGPETRVAYEMDPGSDHLPLITELDANRHLGGHRVPRSPEDTEEYAEVVGAMVGQWAPEAPRSIGDLDALAEGIIGTLQSALTEKPTSGIRPAPWWKGPIKEAH